MPLKVNCMRKREVQRVLVEIMHRRKVGKSLRSKVVREAIFLVLRNGDAKIAWSTGLALEQSAKKHERHFGSALLLLSALLGETDGINNCAISLKANSTQPWQSKISLALLHEAASLGDSLAMWNLYKAYGRTDPKRAIAFLVAASKKDDDALKELERLISSKKMSGTRLKQILKQKPW